MAIIPLLSSVITYKAIKIAKNVISAINFLSKIQFLNPKKSESENDLRSTFGRNVHNILKDADVSSMRNGKTTSFMLLLPEEHWRTNAIQEFLDGI